jgi:hypothetical protein
VPDTDFDFFEQTLHERRTYRCRGERAAWRYDWMKNWHLDDLVIAGSTDGDGADFTFAGTHQMNAPGSPVGVARVNERFNVTLPADFDAFYRRWDGGKLLFRELYPLLSVEQMLIVNERFAGYAKWDGRSPLRLIRFCDMSNTDHLCLRLGDDGKWLVVFGRCQYPDADYFDNWHQIRREITLDTSFRGWLQRMVKTDGWPLLHDGYYEEEIVPPTEQVR